MIRTSIRSVLLGVARRLRDAADKVCEPIQANRVRSYQLSGGDAAHRLSARVSPGGVIVDAGGFLGDYVVEMAGTNPDVDIVVLEPMPEFHDCLRRRVSANQRIHALQVALAASNGFITMGVEADSTSQYVESRDTATVPLMGVEDLWSYLANLGHGEIDVLKLNIEGGEYEVLQALIDGGSISRIERLDIQFHDFAPDADVLRPALRHALAQTHDEIYCFPFVWEGWIRKKGGGR